ncbi:MAG: hypothetical protein ABIV94_01985 [Acidimicrobiales bacterium]
MSQIELCAEPRARSLFVPPRSQSDLTHQRSSRSADARLAHVFAAALLALILLGCSSERATTTVTTTVPQSYACLLAQHRMGFTTGTRVEEARQRLDQLARDVTLPTNERAYYQDLLNAFHNAPDSELLAARSEKVPCPL